MREPHDKFHVLVSILHKCDYNTFARGFQRPPSFVSILHKCDYNSGSSMPGTFVSMMFQFYISAIITLRVMADGKCIASFNST